MWIILHKLFGWHYATYKFGNSWYVGRVIISPNGTLVLDVCCSGWEPVKDSHRQIRHLTLKDIK